MSSFSTQFNLWYWSIKLFYLSFLGWWMAERIGNFFSTQFLSGSKKPKFQTLHVNNIWWGISFLFPLNFLITLRHALWLKGERIPHNMNSVNFSIGTEFGKYSSSMSQNYSHQMPDRPSPRPRGSARRKTASSLILRGHF